MTESRKEKAINFLKLVSSDVVEPAYEKYIHPNFIHHNPYFKGDRSSLLKGMKDNAAEYPDKTYSVKRALEDGELVTVHGEVKLNSEMKFAVIHLFRFQKDLIIELWEASQQEIKDSPNENGLF